MARITVEDCIDKFPSRFELVLVASQRARKLHSGETPKVEKDNDKNTVISLREIADSTFTVAEMKENLIQEYQTITISDEEDENLEIERSESSENSETEDEIKEELENLVFEDKDNITDQVEISEDLDSGNNVLEENTEIELNSGTEIEVETSDNQIEAGASDNEEESGQI